MFRWKFGLGIPFKEPRPLQAGSWSYQGDTKIDSTILEHMTDHFHAWAQGKTDKTLHAVFFSVCRCVEWRCCFFNVTHGYKVAGPGTGKSRLLDEFHGICKRVSESNPELNSRFTKNCFVFKLSFENGSPMSSGLSGSQQIGVRMMYQLGYDQTHV